MKDSFTIEEIIQLDNIADILPDTVLGKIEQQVKRGFDADYQSNDEWFKKIEEAMKLASQISETKTYPFDKASNIKYPIITTAAIQFAANAYPAIVDEQAIVKGKVIGKTSDEKRQRAERVGQHMSYQLSEQMEEWDGDTDSLLHILPIVGCAYRKMYFDPMKGRNCSVLVPADKLIKDYHTELANCQRYTEIQSFYPHEIKTRFLSELWKEVELGTGDAESEDEDAPHIFYEHYCRYDLDDDGYPEPYIVTQHKETGKIVRMVARFDDRSIKYKGSQICLIEEINYHTEYFFMPSPDGGKRGWGFGLLLGPLNEAINTTLNQMIDAAHFANLGGGFIGGGVKIQSGNLRFKPGEWKRLQDMGGVIRDNIVPLNMPGPSAVLFNLLGFLVDAAQDISSVKDFMTGDSNRNQPVGTTLALIERGMKVFSAIYKRVHRSLKKEFKLLYRLNSIYLNPEEYFNVLDQEVAISQQDYMMDDMDVVPVSDPNVVTDTQKVMRAEALMQFAQDPEMNGMEIKKRYLEAIGITEIESLMAEQKATDPNVTLQLAKMELEKMKFHLNASEIEAKIRKMAAETIKALADAEGVEAGTQMQTYLTQLEELKGLIDVGRGIRELEGQPDNPQSAEVPGGLPSGTNGGMG